MKEVIEGLVKDTRKLGRIVALIVVLGVTGAISIISSMQHPDNSLDILSKWIPIAMLAIGFYFNPGTKAEG